MTHATSSEMLARIDGLRQRALIAGAGALVLCGLGAFVNPDQFFRSYLIAFVLWNGVALGSLAIKMLHQMTGGAWGLVIGRLLEAASRTFPYTLLLFLPLVFGTKSLYIWSHPEVVGADQALRDKAPYLNTTFFLARAAFYFAVWNGLAYFLSKWSREQDESGAEPYHTRLQVLSGPGLLLYGFTVTFSSIDWVMSLDPHYSSTIYGILFMGGQGVSALALVITIVVVLGDHEPLKSAITSRHLHDLGKLLFAFIMLWAYFSFSQYLITWSANLPEEIPFYLKRTQGGWQFIAVALLVGHFVLPFALLLSRGTKQNRRLVLGVALFLLFMRLVDIYFLAGPSGHGEGPAALHLHWMDLAAPVAVGGLWLAAFFWQLKQRPLLPAHDPMLEEALEHGR